MTTIPLSFFALVTTLTLLGAALSAGAFVVFSVMVMPALEKLEASAAVVTMQSINVAAERPRFLGIFLGTAALAAITAVASFIHPEPGAPWALAGSLLYIVGGFGVTVAGNVPLNNRLASREPSAESWHRFAGPWRRLNAARGLACTVSVALFAVSLLAAE